MSKPQNGRSTLLACGLAGNLTVLEPYRPIVIGAAVVTFDDGKTSAQALMQATGNAGYPSTRKD